MQKHVSALEFLRSGRHRLKITIIMYMRAALIDRGKLTSVELILINPRTSACSRSINVMGEQRRQKTSRVTLT
jgi:hypothetical protein